MKNKKYIVIIFTLFCVIIAEPFIALKLGNKVVLNKDKYQSMKNISDKYSRHEKVIKKLKRQFLYEVDDEKVKEESLRGAVCGFDDPYTVYFTKEEYKSFLQSMDSTIVGIGVTVKVDYENNLLFIDSIMPNSPALESGLKRGDQIVEIDGEPVDLTTESFDVIVNKIRGEALTQVKLKVIRETNPMEFTVTRKEIEIPNLYSKKIKDVGYIRFLSFNINSGYELKSVINKFKDDDIKKLIIDLRDNPGGLLNEAQVVSGLFVAPNTVITYTKDNKNKKTDIRTENSIYFSNKVTKTDSINFQIVLIVDENSASAAELFAGMMKDYKLATIIGSTTYGKGVVQTTIPFNDGSAVKITTSEYFTPNGNKVNHVGITPDIDMSSEMEEQKKEFELDISPSLSNITEDVCVKKALEILNK